MIKVCICKGLPASGKTTWSKNLLKEGKWKRINKDDLRAMIDNSNHTKENEKMVLELRDMMILHFLKNGYNVVVDDTNLAPIHESNIRDLVKDFPVEVEIKEFYDVPLEECIRRDLARCNSIGARVILDMHSKYFQNKVETSNPHLPKAVIVDIDGTIARKGDRSHYDFEKVDLDIPRTAIIDLVLKLRTYQLIFMSGREDKGNVREKTLDWIEKYVGIKNAMLYMRPENDNREDGIVKEELYNTHVKNTYNVTLAIDDRPRVLRVWRSLGIETIDVGSSYEF